jgi:hypothetical protein
MEVLFAERLLHELYLESRSALLGMELESRCRRQDVFDVDPLGGVVAGVAGGAVAIVLDAIAALEQAFERQVGE